MSFNSQVEKLLIDPDIISYFTTGDRDILQFIKKYINVDKILYSSIQKSDLLYDKLEEIRSVVLNQNTQLSNLSTNFSNSTSILQSKIENIRDITNSELKGMFLELQQQLSRGIETSELKVVFENFRERIDILNNQRLNDIDRKNLEIFSNLQSSFERSLDSHQINNKIGSIETVLSSINENFSNNSAKKGQVAETVLFNVLTEAFQDTEIADTSHLPNSGDIQMIKDEKPTILIDSKNFGSKTVPKRDLDKFYTDIQQNNCSGILCNAFGGIANKQHFEIDIVDKNIIVFIHNHQFDSNLFKLATNIIYNMHQELRDKQTDSIILDQRLYQNIKIEYNYYIQTFRHHLDIIKSNVNSLSQLSFTLLDNFFKRKATNVELKEYSCHVCSAQLSTEKILKTHLKKQHGNILPPTSTTPLVASVVYNPVGRPKSSDEPKPKQKRVRKKKGEQENEENNTDNNNTENNTDNNNTDNNNTDNNNTDNNNTDNNNTDNNTDNNTENNDTENNDTESNDTINNDTDNNNDTINNNTYTGNKTQDPEPIKIIKF